MVNEEQRENLAHQLAVSPTHNQQQLHVCVCVFVTCTTGNKGDKRICWAKRTERRSS